MKKGSLSTPVSSSHLLPAKPLSTLCQRIALSSPASAKAWVAAQKLQPTQKSKKPIISSKDTEPMTFATLVGRSNPASIPTPALALDHTHVGCVASESDCDVGHVAPETDCDLDIDDAIVSATAPAPVFALGTAAQSLVSYVLKTTPQVFEMRLASQPEDFHWMEVSSVYEHCEGKVIMNSSFLKTLNVNPKTFFEKDACTPYEWSHVVLLARYHGDDIQGDTNKSIWHSVNNNTPFAIVWPSVRGRIEKCIDALQLRATKSIFIEGYGQRNGIVPVQNVKVKFSVIKHATMETLLNMPDKVRFVSHVLVHYTLCFCSHLIVLQNAGANRDVCHQVSVKLDGHDNVCLNAGNEDFFAPLLTSVRTLRSWERVASDFSKKETVSEILKQLGCNGKNLNEVDLHTVIKCVEKFSSFEHSAEADEPFTDKVHVLHVTVDVDSVCATFKRRVLSSAQPKDVASILQAIDSVFKDDATFFINTTSFKPNVKSLKQIPTEIKKYGPTIERSKAGYFRIKLPAPMGPEVFNIWLYAPKKMKNFVGSVQAIANECAKALAQKFQSTMSSALESAIDDNLVGFRAFDIPGGYAFPISIALVMCELHQECRFTVETYNCKKKGFRFDASTNTFGSESWSADLVAKMKEFIKKCPTMMKLFCRLDRLAQVVPEDSTIGFGFEMQYTDVLSNRLYSVCKPNIDDCDNIIVYPLAFLPKEMASRLSFLKNGDRIQTYMPAWHQANWRRNQQKDVSNLGFRHCIVKGHENSLQMNVTELLRGAKREQIMVDDVLQRFRKGFCERIEIATSWSFSKDSAHGPMCFYDSEASVSNGCTRWLDLKTMIRTCAGYVDKHTQFWNVGPITDYMTLNFAAAFAMYHLSARAMADTTLAAMEREQCCRTLVYINQLLKLAKDGKLWQHNQQSKLTFLTRGERHNREMMLPSCPSRVYKLLAEAGGIVLERIPTVLPFTCQEVITTSIDSVQMIDDRIRENRCSLNNFGTNVLRCRTCGQCFYGGKGINDNQLFKQHFKEHLDHAVGPTTGEKISNAQWYSDYKTRESDMALMQLCMIPVKSKPMMLYSGSKKVHCY